MKKQFHPLRRRIIETLLGIACGITFSLLFLQRNGTDDTPAEPPHRDYADIRTSGILRAVTEYNSVSYHADGDSLTGFHYELLQAFARDQGLKAEITPEMSFGKRLQGIQEGRFDILANSTVVTSESKDSLLFTRPILLSKQVLVQRKARDEHDTLFIRSQLQLAHKTVHLVKDSPAAQRIRHLSDEIGDTIYIQEIEKYGPEQLLALVAAGDIDYAVCDENMARSSLADLPQLDIHMAISFSQFYSWGVSKHAPVLLDTLNAWLDTYLSSPEFKRLQRKYFPR
ncbi:ABC transporter, periplasmic glutamine-binding protein [gut metagenome]|uniref:ABC transporter, periplasmic glutamine-binding protein n=1 Tax=gut metagenome TaxID=749906 RepID=J9GZL2_9ZZZZ